MDYLRQIQRGIDYIEEHLEDDIDLFCVTQASGVSHWHFQRMFKALTNETIKAYIRSRRLANARIRLVSSDTPVLQIALSAGFDSQASFSRAFKKAFGVPPARYRSLGDQHLFLNKVRIEEAYLRHINQKTSFCPEIARKPLLHMVGLATPFYGVESERNTIGEQLPPLWADFVGRLHEVPHAIAGTCYGIIQQSSSNQEQLNYTAAIEVSEKPIAELMPARMTALEIPGALYATFTHQGEARAIDHTVNYIYSAWLNQSGKRHTYGPDIEIYGLEYDATSATSVMYYAIPIDADESSP